MTTHTQSADTSLSIGDVAAVTGLSVSALRYYDELGLISTSGRVGGKRRFNSTVVGRVSFVQRAQEAGFSLREIGVILDDTAGEWKDMVDIKIESLVERQARLETMLEMLREIRACGCDVVALCPLSTNPGDALS